MAVELTKVALWIETVEPGKPLGFLDANIRCGDALLGVFDLDGARRRHPRRRLQAADRRRQGHREALRASATRPSATGQGTLDFGGGAGRLPAARRFAGDCADLRAMPEDSLDEIAAKAARFARRCARPRRWHLARSPADLYVAAFLTAEDRRRAGQPRRPSTIPTTAHVWQALRGEHALRPARRRAPQDLAGDARAFHWPLEFPDVMAARRLRRGARQPAVGAHQAAGAGVLRRPRPRDRRARRTPPRASRLIAALAKAEPGSRERALFDAFEAAKRAAEASSVFVRVAGDEAAASRSPAAATSTPTRSSPSCSADLAGPKGRAGVIVPTGIATDATTAPFFAALVDEQAARAA